MVEKLSDGHDRSDASGCPMQDAQGNQQQPLLGLGVSGSLYQALGNQSVGDTRIWAQGDPGRRD